MSRRIPKLGLSFEEVQLLTCLAASAFQVCSQSDIRLEESYRCSARGRKVHPTFRPECLLNQCRRFNRQDLHRHHRCC